ncbi:hypothetical protein [Amycolatopsis tolypomycina]|uniref:hypothetical protein n=1 Tax=Amycolatopsis tolypomycina TaxID=208445 RepID=UPI0033A44E69
MTAPDQQPPAYPASEELYAIEVGNYLEAFSADDRATLTDVMDGMSAKDQWEFIQSFYVTDEPPFTPPATGAPPP